MAISVRSVFAQQAANDIQVGSVVEEEMLEAVAEEGEELHEVREEADEEEHEGVEVAPEEEQKSSSYV